MDSKGHSSSLVRPSRWLLVHRLRGTLGVVVIAGLSLALVELSAPPREPRPQPRRREVEPIQVAVAVPWRTWRHRLALAHEARRRGDVCAALDGYRAVAAAARARGQDADHAALWAARLRLELGECSAALALRDLITRCDDPALLSRALLAAESNVDVARCIEWSSTFIELKDVARAKLQALAAQQTDEGQRAARWLRTLASKRR